MFYISLPPVALPLELMALMVKSPAPILPESFCYEYSWPLSIAGCRFGIALQGISTMKTTITGKTILDLFTGEGSLGVDAYTLPLDEILTL